MGVHFAVVSANEFVVRFDVVVIVFDVVGALFDAIFQCVYVFVEQN